MPGSHGYVVVADASDVRPHAPKSPEEGQVIGMLWMGRVPPGKFFDASKMPKSATLNDDEIEKTIRCDLQRNTGLLTRLDLALCALERKYTDLIGARCAAGSPEHQQTFNRFVAERAGETSLPSRWEVFLLATDPQFERRGIGKMLLQHSMRLAEESGTPLTLVSSPQGMGLYTRSGMRLVRWMDFLDKVWEGGALFVWDPWERWVKKVGERQDEKGRKIDGDFVF